jgi:hypothetical protein
MKNKIIVEYWSNPNIYQGYNHVGELDSLTEIDKKTFDNIPEAISFIRDCSHSITQESDILKYKYYNNELSEKIDSDDNISQQKEELSNTYDFWENNKLNKITSLSDDNDIF